MKTRNLPLRPSDLEFTPTNTLIQALMDRSKSLFLVVDPRGVPANSPLRIYTQGEPADVIALAKVVRRAAHSINDNNTDDFNIASP